MADSPRIEELKRRVQSDPASIAFAALAEEYRRAGRFEEAIDTCTTGLVRHPSYLSAHVTLGRALIDVGRLDDAREELQHVLKLAPENLAAIRGLAEIHDRIGAADPGHSAGPPLEGSSGPAMTIAEVQAASGFNPPEPEVSVNAPETRTADVPEAFAPSLPEQADPMPGAWAEDPQIEARDPEPLAAPASFSSQQPSDLQDPSNVAHAIDVGGVYQPAEGAALAGLEQFLKAIQRARAERAAAR
jgi:tetratricopeptide (TPR) repeat protein